MQMLFLEPCVLAHHVHWIYTYVPPFCHDRRAGSRGGQGSRHDADEVPVRQARVWSILPFTHVNKYSYFSSTQAQRDPGRKVGTGLVK